MNSFEKYKTALTNTEKQLKYLQTIPEYQWSIVNNENQIYTHIVGQVKTFKIVKELNTYEINLQHAFASLSTTGMRTSCK